MVVQSRKEVSGLADTLTVHPKPKTPLSNSIFKRNIRFHFYLPKVQHLSGTAIEVNHQILPI